MRKWMSRSVRNKTPVGLVLLFIATCHVAGGQPREVDPHLPTLTTGAAIHSLTPAESKRRQHVHLQAICVVCFEGWHGFFAHDGVTGFYVETKNQVLLTAAIHPGSLLDIEGAQDRASSLRLSTRLPCASWEKAPYRPPGRSASIASQPVLKMASGLGLKAPFGRPRSGTRCWLWWWRPAGCNSK